MFEHCICVFATVWAFLSVLQFVLCSHAKKHLEYNQEDEIYMINALLLFIIWLTDLLVDTRQVFK